MGILVALISAALCAWLYSRMVRREVPEPMPKKQATTPVVVGLFAPILATALVLLIGLCVKVLTGGRSLSELIGNLVISSLVRSFLGAGMTEELVKFLLFLLIVKRLNPKNVYELAVLVAGIGFGFTVLEEISYGSGNVAAGLLRMPGFALHMVFGLVMGVYLGLARYKKLNGESAGKETFLAFFLPILWHTLFDAVTANNAALSAEDDKVALLGVIVALVVVIVSVVLQFVVLVKFKKNTEKYCAMTLTAPEAADKTKGEDNPDEE